LASYLQKRALYPPLITQPPADDLQLVVVIPAREEGLLLRSLDNLYHCDPPACAVEVIVVINSSEEDAEEVKAYNLQTLWEATQWSEKYNTDKLRFHLLHFPGLPAKHAGVGLARKIGMDEACRRLEGAGHPNGVIACFDADSRCDANYLTALEAHFREHPDTQACSVYFEHPLQGDDHPTEVYRAIAQYELHLRYFIDAQRYVGFPFAYQTIGSSMAVRCDAYQQQGGMNRRKAGEDFYFLHKFTALGHFSELNSTRIIPSPRPSHRVPFGTGRAVREMLETGGTYLTYAPDSFEDLRVLPEIIPELYKLKDADWPAFAKKLPDSLRTFMEMIDARKRIANIRRHTNSPETFAKRFYRWFDAFQVMKFMHFARDRYYPNVPVAGAAKTFTKLLKFRKRMTVLQEREADPVKNLLLEFRRFDRRRGDVY